MPIYEKDMSVEEMKRVSKNHICAECGSWLTLSWSNKENCYQLRCVRFEDHNGIRRLGRDPEVAEIRNKLKGEPLQMKSDELKKQTKETMLARVDMAKFPRDLTKVDKALIATISIEYGLDPLFNEMMIYQGRPYITIDARRRKAQETGLLDGINARPATPEEKKARRVPDEDYCFIAEVWVKGASHPFEGVGRVTQKEINEAIAQAKAHQRKEDALPIVKDPAALCEKRAEAQGLRRAFHLPLPSFEDIVEGEFTVIEEKREATTSKSTSLKSKGDTKPPLGKGTLTQPQRQKIWADAEKMGYKEEEVHALIEHKFKAASINDLSIAQASELIDAIQRGEGVPAPQPEPGEEE